MAYEVTATRKRPQVFEKLVGQEFVASTLEHAIEQNRIAHAYLFSGPRGVGKTTSARLLAKSLNCEHGPTAHPCGKCDACLAIKEGNFVDVIEIDGASNTSVNDIRAIKDEVLFPPQASRYKIYIIDEVHMLSNSAFNALLKTIEEPPEYIIFIFATTELQKVPATIRSRCQQFHFQLISLENIKGCLAEAASEMGILADDDALFWIAKEATGSMRDAYTLFDQVVAFSQDHITLEKIKSKLGLVGIDNITNLIRLSLNREKAQLIEALTLLFSKGISVEQCIRDYIDCFRTLLLRKEGITGEEILNHRIEQIPQDLVNAFTSEQLEAVLKYLFDMYREIRYSVSPRFELELFTLRLSRLPYLTTGADLVKQLKEMKADILEGKATIIKEEVRIPVNTTESPKNDNALPASETEKKEEIKSKEEREQKIDFNDEALKKLKGYPTEVFELTLALPYIKSFNLDKDHNLLTLYSDNTLMLDTLIKYKNEIIKAVYKLTNFSGNINFEKAVVKEKKIEMSKDAQILVNRFGGTYIPPQENNKTERF